MSLDGDRSASLTVLPSRAEQKTEIRKNYKGICKGREKNLSGEHIKLEQQEPLSPSMKVVGMHVMQEAVPTDQTQAADDQLCLLLKNIDVISEQGKGTR